MISFFILFHKVEMWNRAMRSFLNRLVSAFCKIGDEVYVIRGADPINF